MIDVPLIPNPVSIWRRWSTRLALAGIVISALVLGHNAYRAHLIDIGRQEVQSAWDAAKASAAEKSATQVQEQTTGHDDDKKQIEVRYVWRTKEVVKYEAKPGTSCPADADFVRLYNDSAGASTGEVQR